MAKSDYSKDEIITLTDDEGKEVECGTIGTFEFEDETYAALEVLDGSEDVILFIYSELDGYYRLDDIPEEDFDRVAAEFECLRNGGIL